MRDLISMERRMVLVSLHSVRVKYMKAIGIMEPSMAKVRKLMRKAKSTMATGIMG